MLGAVIMAEKPARAKRRRKDWQFSVELLRLREIEAIIRHRFNGPVSDPDGTADRETCLDFVRAAAFSLAGQDIASWCCVFAPWATDADLVPIIAEAAKRRRMMRADGVAGLLHVTMVERLALNLKTIGAADVKKSTRTKFMKGRKKECDRKRREEQRRAVGMMDRASYVAQSISTAKPWEALKMSRRTWYRKGKPEVGTSVSRIESIGKSDGHVPPRILPTGDTLDRWHLEPSTSGAAGRERVRGIIPRRCSQEAAPHGTGDAISEEAA